MTKETFFEMHRIYVVLTPKVTVNKVDIPLETGRMMAQACHAASKAKFQYAVNQKDIEAWVRAFQGKGLTTIVLQARDQKELYHVAKLASDKKLNVAYFMDENKQFYGTESNILTAVAIGPVTKEQTDGICDYLPLFA